MGALYRCLIAVGHIAVAHSWRQAGLRPALSMAHLSNGNRYICILCRYDSPFQPASRLESLRGDPVVCPSKVSGPVYRPRRPRQSPLYRIVDRHFPQFERTYDASYAGRYGRWRPIVGEVVRKYLRCGDLHFGFARVRCRNCRQDPLRTLANPRASPCGSPDRHELELVLDEDFVQDQLHESTSESPHELQLVLDPEYL